MNKTTLNSQIICLATSVLLALLPARFHADANLLAETRLSAVTKEDCRYDQLGKAVGKAVFVKGQTVLNGALLQQGDTLHKGDTISTAVDGYAAIELQHGKVVTLQPGTLLRIDCGQR